MRHQHALGRSYATRDQAAVRQIAEPHRDVDPLFHEIDKTVAQA
jgi:hypothetical protein